MSVEVNVNPYDADPWATDVAENDPWAAEPPADEAQTSLNTAVPSKESTITSNDTSEGRIVTTIKYGPGYDAPWTVIHSSSVEEATETLNKTKALLELTARVAKFAKTLDSGTAPATPRGGGSNSQRQASTPPGQQGKTCAHGEMVYRTGNGAKGAWKAYFCPLDRNDPDACKVVWVK